jgi:hypothetical protein
MLSLFDEAEEKRNKKKVNNKNKVFHRKQISIFFIIEII